MERLNVYSRNKIILESKRKVLALCGKIGHVASDCKFRKGQDHHQPKPQANLTESEVIAVVVSEVNLVNNMIEWVVDTGASRHIYSNKEMFLDYEKVMDGESVYLGDARVPNMRRNLVSRSLLNKAGLKLVFEADKLVLTRNGDFVGKGYCHGGLFVLDASFDKN